MNEYHKIRTVFNRDPETKYRTLIEGNYSLPEFEYLMYNKWIWTEKVDGTNIRIMWDDEQITFRGKTERAQLPGELVNTLSAWKESVNFKDYFDEDTEGVCLYGEGYGPKIQSGGKYRDNQAFVLFDVKIGKWWLKRKDVEDIADNFHFKVVPIIGEGTLIELVEKVRTGFNSEWGNFIAEGIVARPEIELKARNGERIITKLKYKDFPR